MYKSFSERKEILYKIQGVIKEHFGHWESSLVSCANLEKTTESFIKRAAVIENKTDFILLLLEYLNQFNNGHTLCLDQTIDPIEFDIAAPLGFRIEHIEDNWTVTTSYIPGLLPGDRLISINDEPIDVFVENQIKYFNELSNPLKTMRLNLFLPYLIRGTEFKLAYKDQDDIFRKMCVNRNGLRIPFPKISGKWLKDSETAYIDIPSFLKPEYENTALELVESFKSSKMLIVDVRGNQGGNTPHRLISSLMNVPFRRWREKWKQDRFFSDSDLIQPKKTAYSGNLVILADRNTFSSGEDFVMPFKDNHRAVIIGEKTFGSTGQPYFTMIDTIMLSVGSMRVQLPNGMDFEGIGIEPDVTIAKRIEHLYKNELVFTEILELAEKSSMF